MDRRTIKYIQTEAQRHIAAHQKSSDKDVPPNETRSSRHMQDLSVTFSWLGPNRRDLIKLTKTEDKKKFIAKLQV